MSWTLINTAGEQLWDRIFDNVFAPSLERLTVLDGKNWGLMNGHTLEWRIPPKYDELRTFIANITSGQRNGRYGLIRDDGMEIGSWDCDLISYFSDGLAESTFQGRHGYLCSDGSWGIPAVFSDASGFREERAIVRRGQKLMGYIDTGGNPVTECKYTTTRAFGGGLAFVRDQNGRQGFIDQTGAMVLAGDWFQTAFSYSEGFCEYCTRDDDPNAGVGFLNLDGRPAFDRIFQKVHSFRNGIAAVKFNGKWGAISKTGALVVPTIYDRIGQYAHGLLPAYKNGKCGYISASNEVKIPFEFELARSFSSDGVAVVKLADSD